MRDHVGHPVQLASLDLVVSLVQLGFRVQTAYLEAMAGMVLPASPAPLAKPESAAPRGKLVWRAPRELRARTERLVRRGIPESEARRGLRVV